MFRETQQDKKSKEKKDRKDSDAPKDDLEVKNNLNQSHQNCN